MTASLLIVGGGKMGGALLSGWLAEGVAPSRIHVVEPNRETSAELRARHGVAAVTAMADLPQGYRPNFVLLAVKPQVMADVVPAYRLYAGGDCVFVSIAAGKKLAFFEGILGSGAAIVRTMPNTPAAIGRGVTAAVANGQVSDHQIQLCTDLLTAVGTVHWLDDEELIDAVTAISGCGPAYIFWLTECLAAAGEELGLSREMAAALARETVSGAGDLMHRAGESPATLRQNVTSPGGSTEAALDLLMAGDGLKPLMLRAARAAQLRAGKLAE